jgi:protein O-GlcNAcase/histone acetyltransferase
VGVPSPASPVHALPDDFLAGVIEGFYGAPWTQAERFQLFDWMAGWGLNTYLYAPKDDLKHRAIWREPYSAHEAEELGELIQACQHHGLHFIYGLSPGLDLRYASASDLELLQQRFEQMLTLGCAQFGLLFDDIPDRVAEEDLQRWGSLASAQAGVSNAMFCWLRERQPAARLLFCPTPYCGRMAERKLGGEDYLPTLGKALRPEIDIFWTGPEIISRDIPVPHVLELEKVLRRKPVIWDNLHANDYDGRRFFCGPYSGRPRELMGHVRGLLSNPNCEFPLNFIPLQTLGEFVHGTGAWDPRAAFLRGLQVWGEEFQTVGRELDSTDLLLFADCYYLPHEEGASAEEFCRALQDLLSRPPAEWGAQGEAVCRRVARFRDWCGRLTELRQRPLFHALSRRIWELREELDLLDRGLTSNASSGRKAFQPFGSDFHLPGTYRGGVVPRLQGLLAPQPDGTFAPPPQPAPARVPSLTPCPR